MVIRSSVLINKWPSQMLVSCGVFPSRALIHVEFRKIISCNSSSFRFHACVASRKAALMPMIPSSKVILVSLGSLQTLHLDVFMSKVSNILCHSELDVCDLEGICKVSLHLMHSLCLPKHTFPSLSFFLLQPLKLHIKSGLH